MEKAIPAGIEAFVKSYIDALEPLKGRLYGIYIYGSIALEAFEEDISDIDVVALTNGYFTPSELMQLEAIHARLIKENELGKRLEVMYIPLADIGKDNYEIEPYPFLRDGRFVAAGKGDLNAVTWWLVRHKGIRLLGAESEDLPIKTEWADVLKTMRYNLEVYWAGKAKRPFLFWFDAWVVFGVMTICRILTTIELGEIVPKSAALGYWRKHLPARFHLVLAEAERIRHERAKPSLYRFRINRMRDVLALIKYARERGLVVSS